MTPPRFAAWLLSLCASEEQVEAVLGDLQEEFTTIADARGLASARRWYWRQALVSSARFALVPIVEHPGWTLAIAIGALLMRYAITVAIFALGVQLPQTGIPRLFTILQAPSPLWGLQPFDLMTIPLAAWIVARYSKMRPFTLPLALAVGSFAFGITMFVIVATFRPLPDVVYGTDAVLFQVRYNGVVMVLSAAGAAVASLTPRRPHSRVSRLLASFPGALWNAGHWLAVHRDYAGTPRDEPRDPREP